MLHSWSSISPSLHKASQADTRACSPGMKMIARPKNMYAVRTSLALGLADLVEGEGEILDWTGATSSYFS
jgi:hypothetical protein